MKTVFTYLIAIVVFFAIDLLWLGWIARNFYRQKICFLLAEQVNWPAAVIFYLLYIGGILFFAVLPAMRDQKWQTAVLHGAVLGLVSYATYDLTNQATLKGWPLQVTLVDIGWGIFLTGSVAVFTFLIAARLP